MKFFVTIAAIALSVALTSARVVRSTSDLQDFVDAALAFQEGQLKLSDPLKVPDVPRTPIITPWLNETASLANLTVVGASNRVVDVEHVNTENLSALVTVRWPSVVETFNYTAEGVYKGRKFQGAGDARLEIQNSTATIGISLIKIKLPFLSKSFVQITSLDISNTLGNVTLNINGLKIENMTVADLEKAIVEDMTAFFNTGKDIRERLISLDSQAKFNLLLAGKSLEDATAWLKEHTNTKQYPLIGFLTEAIYAKASFL